MREFDPTEPENPPHFDRIRENGDAGTDGEASPPVHGYRDDVATTVSPDHLCALLGLATREIRALTTAAGRGDFDALCALPSAIAKAHGRLGPVAKVELPTGGGDEDFIGPVDSILGLAAALADTATELAASEVLNPAAELAASQALEATDAAIQRLEDVHGWKRLLYPGAIDLFALRARLNNKPGEAMASMVDLTWLLDGGLGMWFDPDLTSLFFLVATSARDLAEEIGRTDERDMFDLALAHVRTGGSTN